MTLDSETRARERPGGRRRTYLIYCGGHGCGLVSLCLEAADVLRSAIECRGPLRRFKTNLEVGYGIESRRLVCRRGGGDGPGILKVGGEKFVEQRQRFRVRLHSRIHTCRMPG